MSQSLHDQMTMLKNQLSLIKSNLLQVIKACLLKINGNTILYKLLYNNVTSVCIFIGC